MPPPVIMKSAVLFNLFIGLILGECQEAQEIQDFKPLIVNCRVNNEHELGSLMEIVETEGLDLWQEGIASCPAELTIAGERDSLKSLLAVAECDAPMGETEFFLKHYPDEQEKSALTLDASDSGAFHQQYQRYDAIIEKIAELAAKAPSDKVIVETDLVGKSWENRDLVLMKISSPECKDNCKKVWVSCGQHAREWIAPASCLHAAEQLINNPKNDKSITEFLSEHTVYMLPLVNPDGYEYSHTNSRMWRKNRRRNRDGSYGVDLNRNWPSKWSIVGASSTPRSDTYCGHGPASEPEVQAVVDYMRSHGPFQFGVDVHCAGEWILRNLSWSTQSTPQEAQLKAAGDIAAKNMNALYNERYESMKSSGLYPTGGSMDDFFYYGAGCPGFTFEMRDKGTMMFKIPPSNIIPTGHELLTGIMSLAAYFDTNQVVISH